MIKTLFYLNSLGPAAGMERVVTTHASFFLKMGEVYILTKDSCKSFFDLPEFVIIASLNINIKLNMSSRAIRLAQLIYGSLIAIVRLRIRVKKLKPNFIYVPSPLNLLEVLIATGSIKNAIVTEHASFESYNRVYKRIVRFLYPHAALVICPNNSDSMFYKSLGCPVYFIPNPLSYFPNILPKKRCNLGLHVGRLVDDKDQYSLIRAWKLVSDQNPYWKLRIVGAGENYFKLQQLIIDNKMSKVIEIIPPTTELINHYIDASFFLLTSRAEGFGMVLVEAMSFGLPCVAFDCPVGPREIITNGHNGFLVKLGDIEQFSNCINLLISDKNKRIQLSSNARMSSRLFHKDLIFKKWQVLLMEVMCKCKDSQND
jgi:glycosyltransferase involved in cell wall biosynthesis